MLLAEFKNQNQVNGLPLLLSPHEVATATARGESPTSLASNLASVCYACMRD